MNNNLLLTTLLLFFGYAFAMEERAVEPHLEKPAEIKKLFSELPEEMKQHILRYMCDTGNLKPADLAQKLLQIIEAGTEKETIALLKRFLKCVDLIYPDSKIQAEIFKAKDFDSTALMMAIVERSRTFVQLILNHIKTLDQDVQIDILNVQDRDRVTALISAVINKFVQITKLLLNHISEFPENVQVDILNTKDLIEKKTILMRAAARASKQDVQIVELILNQIKSFSKENQNKVLEAKDENYKTALDYAKYRSHRYKTSERLKIIKLLQEALK